MKINKIYTAGFSLIELLISIAIITMIASVVLASFEVAKGKAQDAQRITELNQLKNAIELYHVDHGHYPRQREGANGKIGEGSGLDTLLRPYMTVIPTDPAGPGHPQYYYYYDGEATCGGVGVVAVVFAFNMSQQSGSGADYCTVWGGEGGSGTEHAYHIVLGRSN